MNAIASSWLPVFLVAFALQHGRSEPLSGGRLPVGTPGVTVWWAPSGAIKIRPQSPPPDSVSGGIDIHCARNEWEAVNLVVRSTGPISGFRVSGDGLKGPGGASFPGAGIEVLSVKYLEIAQPSDARSEAGGWPDPLMPVEGPLGLGPGTNHAFWLRLFVPKETRPGAYKGSLRLEANEFSAAVPLELVVYGFALPDRKSCVTAFGFSAEEVFRYHGLRTEEQKRAVLDKYLANLAAHHISPYDPAPLDSFKVRWPAVKPPRSIWEDWSGLRIVTNEVHSGRGALLVYDDQPGANVAASYEPLIPIPAGGLRFQGWYRTAVPGHRFLVTFTHFDGNREWMSGRNNDITLAGNGQWQRMELPVSRFPEGAKYVQVYLRATVWAEQGEPLGLVWFDDISLSGGERGGELLPGGDFEPKARVEPVIPAEKLRAEFDFSDWDRAMDRAMNVYHFNSFKVEFPGLGGGTFHAIDAPRLLGFGEGDPEYELLMESYGRQLEDHLRQRGWLDRAYVYWFDEPDPDQYPFVMSGFGKLKRHAPGLARMLTEQVEAGLVGGPNLWCPISNEYSHEPAQARRALGEKFWWYVCTGPKAPYAGLFIDHPAPEMRIWVWQTWQRGIEGLLVWQINYWTSSAAYPEAGKPQNPYEDPMSWTSGYSTPAGKRLPWGNGDGRFIYPPPAAAGGNPAAPVLAGPVDSIRWEHLRDGIEDYEYLTILRARLARGGLTLSKGEAATVARLLEVPESITRSMTEFARDGAPIEAQRRLIGRAIEQLGDPPGS